ncbi:hypothetical protein Dimus_000144 [Dionaea muscipula]
MDMEQQGLKMRAIITKRSSIITTSSTTMAEDKKPGSSTGGGGGGAKVEIELEEPLSPGARIFHTSKMNCCIIAMIGLKTEVNVDVIKEGLENTLIKHPRFSSKLVVTQKSNIEEHTWVRTNVNLDSHVIVPNLDPNIESPDQFVEDYVSDLTKFPIDISKPLWEVHLLNIKTSSANGIIVLKMHHSLGDGMSLISLLLACTRKSSDPDALPTLPTTKRNISSHAPKGSIRRYVIALWYILSVIWNTLVQSTLFAATSLFLKDSDTPIKGATGIETTRKRIIHRTISLDDIKLVKNAMDHATINDVILGITQAGLSRYLNRIYGDEAKAKGTVSQVTEKTDYLPKNIRLRATTLINIRPTAGIQDLAHMMEKGSDCRWGNAIGYILIPFHIALQDDPLNYIREAKAVIDQKKLSLEAKFSYYSGRFIMRKFGAEAASLTSYRVVSHATMSFSNVAGPAEELTFYGHPIAYLAPTVFGHPQALTVHFQSYADKMIIVVAVDEGHIPDPHRLCDDLEESLQLMKCAVDDLRPNKHG